MGARFRAWIKTRSIVSYCGVFACLLFAGTVWLLCHRVDRQMRDSLQQQTQLLAQSINPDLVRALTGTPGDLGRGEYQLLKEELSHVRKADAKYRFVYLMGRRADGKIFFYLDADNDDPAPPGKEYPEASDEFRSVFDTGRPLVEGPLPDEWGVWVSATVPILDPATGKILAVLGMDSEAADWRSEILARVAWPAGVGILVLGGIVAGVGFLRRQGGHSQLLLMPLMLPLTAILLLLIAGGVALLILQHQEDLDQSSQQFLKNSAGDLSFAISQQYSTLEGVEASLTRDPALVRGLQSRDAKALLADFEPVFLRLKNVLQITHFYLLDPDLNVVLRVHAPTETVGRNALRTAQEAARTKETIRGIEIGTRGTVTLRVVCPVYAGQTLVGYIELGQEIERVLQAVHEKSGTELALALHKQVIKPEVAARIRARVPGWDRLPDRAVLYSSVPLQHDADALLRQIGDYVGRMSGDFAFGGKEWRVSVAPLADASGVGIGEIMIMLDITGQKNAHRQVIWLAVFSGLLILAGVCGGLFVILRRTDNRLRSQIEMIRDGEERYYVLFSDSPDAYLIVTNQAYSACNRSACEMFRCSAGDILGATLGAFSPEFQPDGSTSVAALQKHCQAAQAAGKTCFEWLCQRADGTQFWCELVASPIVVHGTPMLFLAMRDITEKKNTREQLLQSERMSAIGLLAAGIAHNFNNLHAGILGQLELLERKEALSENGLRKLSLVVGAVRRAVDLTENILILSGKRHESRIVQLIAPLIGDTVEIVRNEFERDGIRLELAVEEEARLDCNGGEICHVVLNMLLNARDAMIGAAEKRIRIESSREGGRLCLRFSDTGCGIAPEVVAHLFTPFFSTKGVYANPGSPMAAINGTGLGLCSSKAIVESHQGEIGIESEVGKGTTVTIRLPLAGSNGFRPLTES